MKITDLELYLVEVPRSTSQPPIRSLVVRISTDSSIEGWGEARAVWRAEELPSRREMILPSLAGHSIFDTEELCRLDCLDSPNLRCAVEMACWDTMSRALGQPLCNLLGGVYRKRVPVAVRLAPGSPEAVASLSRVLAEQGFHTQMVTTSGDAAKDIDVVQAVADASAGRVEMRFDAKNRFDLETVRELCRELESSGLQFLLDPLSSPGFDQLAALGRQTNVPLAVSTGITSPADVMALARAAAAPLVIVDWEQVGGLGQARTCAAVAEAAGITPVLGKADCLGISVAAMLQLAAATPSFSISNPCSHHELRDDVLSEPLEVVDGMMAVPQGAGLGLEVSRAKVERFQIA